MTTQPSLFDMPPFHHDGLATEKAAADSMRVIALSLREAVYHFIQIQGRYGATRDELDLVIRKTPNVTQPRLVELEREGRIRKTSRTRESRSHRQCTVYVAWEYHAEGDL